MCECKRKFDERIIVMKKKILALCVVISLAAVAIIGGTLAYFTDDDAETNTFTVGSVDIELIESQYHRVNAGKGTTTDKEPISGGYLWASNVTLSGTEGNTPDAKNSGWTGEYFSDEQIQEDAKTYKDGYFKTTSEKMVPGRNVRKNPYVINNGKNDAFVRVRVLVPCDLFNVLDNGPSFWTSSALENAIVSKAVNAYDEGSNLEEYKVSRDGKTYYEFDFTYTEKLAPGAMTFWNAWGNIAIDKNATAEDLADVDTFDVIIEADAIQAEGFESYVEAFKAFDAEK